MKEPGLSPSSPLPLPSPPTPSGCLSPSRQALGQLWARALGLSPRMRPRRSGGCQPSSCPGTPNFRECRLFSSGCDTTSRPSPYSDSPICGPTSDLPSPWAGGQMVQGARQGSSGGAEQREGRLFPQDPSSIPAGTRASLTSSAQPEPDSVQTRNKYLLAE